MTDNDFFSWVEFIGFLEKAVPLSIQQNSSHTTDKRNERLPFWESHAPLGPVSPTKHTEHSTSTSNGMY